MKLVLNTRFDHKYGRWLNERTRRGPVEVSFLPPCFLLPWDTADSRESSSPLQWWTQLRRPGDPGPHPLLFLAQTEARRAEKKMFWDRAPPYLWVWMTPPPLFILRSASATALSEQISSAFSLRLHWPKHSICSIDKCTFCLCYTYSTSLSLFFLSNRNGSLVISV